MNRKWWNKFGPFMKRCPRRIGDGMSPSRQRGWGMAESSMWPRCSDVRNEPLSAGWPSWRSCRTIRQRDECGDLVVVGKKMVENQPELAENLKSVLEVRTAGNPDEADVLWTDLSPQQIAAAVTEMGTPVSPPVVRDWLEDQGLARHKIEKTLAGGASPDRNAQFERIAELKAKYLDAGNPVFSIDTKAKEHLGQLFRAGRVWTQKAFQGWDHDFPSWATGVIIPHGIYDHRLKRGHLNIGLSHDTSQFACDSFRWYWNRIGSRCYPNATSILCLCDAGGSNSATQHLFKRDLQNLVNDLGVEIRVAHYPSYCSKFNPIERRFFPHVARACQGMLFDTLDTVVRLMRKASTTTGLRTTVNVIRRAYETGRKVARDFKQTMTIQFDTLLPKWNYRAIPCNHDSY
jgi:Rhodopirellula transposase DDE domain